jgi:hypothetical protein
MGTLIARYSTRPFPAGWLVAALIALLPLACWPGASRPFSLPKLWLMGGLDLLVVAQVLRAPKPRPMPPWPWLAWIAAVSLSAVTGPYLSPQAFLLAVLPLPLYFAGVEAVRAVCIGSAAESAIVLLQFFNHDPFQWLGWQPETFASSRMHVYGTLGNPDFVAAWLCTTLPLCVLARGATTRVALLVLQLAAIFCTGSRVFLLALPAAVLVSGLRTRRLEAWWLLAVPVICALLWFSPARPVGATVQGRLHLARVTAAHLGEVPVAGYGPGSFEPRFAQWQVAWLRDHREDARFSGPVDHAHNDYLEFWVEYGPLGLGAFLVLGGWLLARAWRSHVSGGALPALAALLVIACVDFPLHRPAESALFAILASLTRRIE